MSLHDKLKKISSSNKSNWVEDAGKELAKSGARLKARQIALRILHLLKEKNITQAELAQRMGVSRQQVTKIVKGQENITLETIDKVERALDTTLIAIDLPKGLQHEDHAVFSEAAPAEHNEEPDKLSRLVRMSAALKVMGNKNEQFHGSFIIRSIERLSSRPVHTKINNQGSFALTTSLKLTADVNDFGEYYGAQESCDYSKS